MLAKNLWCETTYNNIGSVYAQPLLIPMGFLKT